MTDTTTGPSSQSKNFFTDLATETITNLQAIERPRTLAEQFALNGMLTRLIKEVAAYMTNDATKEKRKTQEISVSIDTLVDKQKAIEEKKTRLKGTREVNKEELQKCEDEAAALNGLIKDLKYFQRRYGDNKPENKTINLLVVEQALKENQDEVRNLPTTGEQDQSEIDAVRKLIELDEEYGEDLRRLNDALATEFQNDLAFAIQIWRGMEWPLPFGFVLYTDLATETITNLQAIERPRTLAECKALNDVLARLMKEVAAYETNDAKKEKRKKQEIGVSIDTLIDKQKAIEERKARLKETPGVNKEELQKCEDEAAALDGLIKDLKYFQRRYGSKKSNHQKNSVNLLTVEETLRDNQDKVRNLPTTGEQDQSEIDAVKKLIEMDREYGDNEIQLKDKLASEFHENLAVAHGIWRRMEWPLPFGLVLYEELTELQGLRKAKREEARKCLEDLLTGDDQSSREARKRLHGRLRQSLDSDGKSQSTEFNENAWARDKALKALEQYNDHANEETKKALDENMKSLIEMALQGDFVDLTIRDSHPLEVAAKGDLFGLALSGGGIRSATFNLGLLQGLAGQSLLGKFDYLSTVSGGGYIGSWMLAWLKRKGFKEVSKRLKPDWKDHDGKEPPEIEFLRSYSNYLTPELGFLSADTWSLVATWVRNLLLNLTILMLAVSAVLLLPRLFVNWSTFGHHFIFLALTVVLMLFAIIMTGLNLRLYARRGIARREEYPRYSEQLAIQCTIVIPTVFASWLGSCWLWNQGRNFVSHPGMWIVWMVVGAALTFLVWSAAWLYSLRNGVEENSDQLANTVKPLDWGPLVSYSLFEGAVGGLLFFALATLCSRVPVAKYPGIGVHFAVWGTGLVAAIFGLMVTLHIGLMGKSFPDERREWWSRVNAWLTIYCLAWTALFAIALYSPLVVQWADYRIKGVVTLGWLAHTIAGVVAARSPKTGGSGAPNGTGFLIKAAPYVFVVGLLVLLSTGIYHAVVHYENGSELERRPLAAARSEESKRTSVGGHPLFQAANPPGGLGVGVQHTAAFRPQPMDSGAGDTNPPKLNGKHSSTPRKPCCKPTVIHFDFSSTENISTKSAPLPPPLKTPTSFYDQASAYWSTVTRGPRGLETFKWILLSALLAWLFSRRVDINEFSMHLLYRNRLVRCYLGASHQGEGRTGAENTGGTTGDRNPNPFTGFDPEDNIYLAGLAQNPPPYVRQQEKIMEPYVGPYPILNTTLNVTHGKRLAWQERKAESFIFTPRYCGFDVKPDRQPRVSGKKRPGSAGYRPTADYLYSREERCPGGPFLGTALGISGAALSPNMGYHTSSSLAFLMTIFDVRTGWWAGNPRHETAWKTRGPELGILYLFLELFGSTDDESNYVYLSDGGHFENLGIYELVRRRCRLIVASDASEDSKYGFEDLGKAIRKCREDLGIEIEIDVHNLRPAGDQKASSFHYAVGIIRYDKTLPQARPGVLIYIKASLTGDEPADVFEYKNNHNEFPHDSTADQWFSESQFESYRRLGLHILEQCEQAETRAHARLPVLDLVSRDEWRRNNTYQSLDKYLLANLGGIYRRQDQSETIREQNPPNIVQNQPK